MPGQRERKAFLQPLCNRGQGKAPEGRRYRVWQGVPREGVSGLPGLERNLGPSHSCPITQAQVQDQCGPLDCDHPPEGDGTARGHQARVTAGTAHGHVIGGIYLRVQEAPQCLGHPQGQAEVWASSSHTTTSELELGRILNSNLVSSAI